MRDSFIMKELFCKVMKKSYVLWIFMFFLVFVQTVDALPPIKNGDSGNFTVEIFNTTGDFVNGCSPQLLFHYPHDNRTTNNSIDLTEYDTLPGRYNATTAFTFSQNGLWMVLANCTSWDTDGFIPAADMFRVVDEYPLEQYQNLTSGIGQILGNLSLVQANQSVILERLLEMNITVTDVLGNLTNDVFIRLNEINGTVNTIHTNITEVIDRLFVINSTVEGINLSVFENQLRITVINSTVEGINLSVLTNLDYLVDANNTLHRIEDDTGNNTDILLEMNTSLQANFTFILSNLQDINLSVDNIETNTETIITNVDNFNFSMNTSVYNILGNLSNVYNDTQHIRLHLNCSSTLTDYICDRLNSINETNFGLLSTINTLLNSHTENLTRLLFLLETQGPHYSSLIFESGFPEDGWDKQYFVRLRSKGVEDSPQVELIVPVRNGDDIVVMNELDDTIEFDYKRSLLGTGYITFRPVLPVCLEDDDQSVYTECNFVDYKVWTKNEVGTGIALFDRVEEIREDLQLGKVKSWGRVFDEGLWWIVGGFISLVLLLLFISFLLWDQRKKPKSRGRQQFRRVRKAFIS